MMGMVVRQRIWLFGNKMENSNGLQQFVNVILKSSLTVECLIIKRNYKSFEMKIEKVLLYQNYAIFLRVAKKTLVKPWNKTFHYTTALFHKTFKSKCDTIAKSCFIARAGKIHLCVVFTVYAQLHIQFFILAYDLNLSMSMLQVCFR